jgi:hypothetical protein
MSKKEDEARRDYGSYEYNSIYRMYKPGAADSDNYVADTDHMIVTKVVEIIENGGACFGKEQS